MLVSFDSNPYPNGKWEIESDGWRFYHDPSTIRETSGAELSRFLCGYPGGPDWSYALPEPFVLAYENRLKDELLWVKAKHAVITEGWRAARLILEPIYGWPARDPVGIDYWSHRIAHVSNDRPGCGWCAP